MKCPQCQQDNPSHAKFCLGCGAPLGVEALGGSYSDLQAEIEELRRSLGEAAEQQTATAEILRAISASSTGLQGVLDTVAARASSLCGAANVSLYQVEGDVMRKVAERGPQLTALPVGGTRPITRGSVSGRAILDRSTIHLRDHQAPEVSLEFPDGARQDTGIRTTVGIPLLREGLAIGAFTVYRTEYRPFSDGEIALLRTFADQAVIAIEHVRLFAELQEKNTALTQAHVQVTESLEQQTATSEILRTIAGSPTDLQPVLDALIDRAAKLCDARRGVILRREGESYHGVAFYNVSPELVGFIRHHPVTPGRHTITARVALERRTIHVADLQTDPHYQYALKDVEPIRTELGVPIFRGGDILGVIILYKLEVQPFTDKQIELVETFAHQAVIAIENVRLFTELQTSNRELSAALDTQTATSDILRVISASRTDVQPVFDAIVASAVRLLRGYFAALTRLVSDQLELAATTSSAGAEHPAVRTAFPQSVHNSESVHAQAIRQRGPVNVADAQTDPAIPEALRAVARARGFRSLVAVPLLRQREVLGTIAVARREPGGFTDDEIALLQTFADQAVIAIENVRLFTELQEKNRELTAAHAQVTESLEQQTATSEVLRVISSSRDDVRPVFQTILENAMRLCSSSQCAVFRLVDGQVHLVAGGVTAGALHAYPAPLDPRSVQGMAVIEKRAVHIPDLEADDRFPASRAIARAGNFRSLLFIPLLKDGAVIGSIGIGKAEPFTDAQIALLQTFADQAAIAIENVRLFRELRDRTQQLSRSVEQLTALGEVGRAVSSTLDLETVLRTIVSRAVQLSGLDGGVVFEYDDVADEFVHRVATEAGGALAEARRATRVRRGEGVVGQTALTLEPAQVHDITVPGVYVSRLRENLIESGVRAILAVPIVREGDLIGCLVVSRNRPGEFTADTIELLRTFATHSALAIQNARLFREIEEKSRELEAASQHKSEFLANMSHELRTPLNAIIGFSEVLSERMFGELNEKQDEYLKDIHASGQHLLSLINDILDLSKIEAGRMELEVSAFELPAALDNALTLVRERAGRRGIELGLTVDERLGQINADERKVRQVVLNLLSNAIKFTPEGGRIDVRAMPIDGSVEVSVTDTGIGIAPEDQEAIFEEFKQVGTAAKKVEGTGLGLALSRKFIELHGGRIWVKSELGAGSTFTFTIPVRHGE